MRVSDRLVLARRQPGHQQLTRVTLFTYSRLRFPLQTCYFTALLGISSKTKKYVMFSMIETDRSELSQGKVCGDQLFRFLDHNFGKYRLSTSKLFSRDRSFGIITIQSVVSLEGRALRPLARTSRCII